MAQRTTSTTVTFARPFRLAGLNDDLPAGDYNVETDEELLDGLSFPVWRRISSFLRLHDNASRPGIAQTLTVDPGELDAAIARDQQS